MAQKYKVGDVVRLRSGGPTMTVANFGEYDYEETGKYLCRWFGEKHKLEEQTFKEEEIELVHP